MCFDILAESNKSYLISVGAHWSLATSNKTTRSIYFIFWTHYGPIIWVFSQISLTLKSWFVLFKVSAYFMNQSCKLLMTPFSIFQNYRKIDADGHYRYTSKWKNIFWRKLGMYIIACVNIASTQYCVHAPCHGIVNMYHAHLLKIPTLLQ